MAAQLATRPEQRLVAIGGGRRLNAHVWPGRGTPVVLLHGMLDSAHGWTALAPALERPAIAFDLPGFGSSDLPARPRLDAYADDVIAALDALGHDSFVLVGHSLGGGVAATVAHHAPERVAALVLLAPAGFGRIPLAEALSRPGLRGVASRALPLALANPLVTSAGYMAMVAHRRLPERELVQRLMRGSFEAIPGARDATRAIVAAGLSEHGFHRTSHAYGGPVRALWGQHDRLVPLDHARALAQSLPQAHVSVWPRMGHHPQREHPERLARLVATACADADDPAAQAGTHGRRSVESPDGGTPRAA